MNCAYLILGGNIGNRAALIAQAEKILNEKGVKIVKGSGLYETAPWQMEKAENFLNKVIAVETENNAKRLMAICLETEKQLGRTRSGSGYVSRNIDIDILFFNDEIIKDETIEIPHPRLHLRRFVLVPMMELSASHIHPVFGKSISLLLSECDDTSEVNAFQPA